MASAARSDLLVKALSQGPLSSEELQERLCVSQPTLSRVIQAGAPHIISFKLPGVRSPFYAKLRSLEAVKSRQPMYRVDASGRVERVCEMLFIVGGATVTTQPDGNSTLYDGLPPAMTFASPAGFLGRAIATEASKRIAVPEALQRWTDDHRVIYLCTLAPDTPGNLIFGDASLSLMLERRNADPITAHDRHRIYAEIANDVTRATGGSSAGGEQPKFAVEIDRIGHVIVKFARTGSRMSDLLIMEELALATLNSHGIPAAGAVAQTRDGITFLEVRRFDRIDRHGRLGALSAGAYDDERFGFRDSWAEFADRCEESGAMISAAADRVRTLAAFGQLIGNTDMHFENLSLLTDDAPMEPAPAYDMLPMKYATVGGSMDPPLDVITPKVAAIGARSNVWKIASEAAEAFWRSVASETRLSAPMRALAPKNAAAAAEFVKPLLSGDDGSEAEGGNPVQDRPRSRS